jgi:putative ABC transport system permease protein
MDTLIQDIRYAVRMMLKRPSFPILAVLTLALGIGATTAIFSVINSVLFKPLPYPEHSRLVKVWEKRPALNRIRNSVSAPDFVDWKAQNTVFEDMAAYTWADVVLGGSEVPQRIIAARISPNLFSTLGVQPQRGRLFQAEEEQIGKHRVVLISDGLWKRQFASDPNIIDREITLNGSAWTIVGVMPARFAFPDSDVEIWIPLTFSDGDRAARGSHYLEVIARLNPDITIEQAQQNMDDIAGTLESQYQVNTGHGVNVFSLYDEAVGEIETTLWILFGAVLFVLLIGCANVANLLLARAASRQSEISVRTALGAGRWRIVRQLITESLLLSIIGGLLGVLLAMWGVDFLLSVSPDSIPRNQEIGLDWAALGFTLLISVATGIIFGVVPALQASKPNLNESLKEGSRTTGGSLRRNRVRSFFVIAEVAICLVLLVGAGLMIRSFIRLINVNPGFNPENVLTIRFSPGRKYDTTQKVSSYFKDTMARISAVPDVVSTGAVLSLPLSGGAGSRYFGIEGRPPQPAGQGFNANLNFAAPGYFTTMGIPLLSGRDFSDSDAEGSDSVAIVNQEMVRMFWPDEEPLGQRIRVGDGPWRRIVGVVGNLKYKAMDADTRQEMYWPFYQTGAGSGAFVVRTRSDPQETASGIRNAILEVERDQPLYEIRTMEELLSESVSGRWLNTLLLGVFGGEALILAVVGLYGVMSYSVAQRTRELGIRTALGATSRDVARLIVGQGMRMAAVGVAIGIGGAFGLTRLMSSLLFDIKAFDPLTIAAIALLLVAVAFVACWVPARRAAKVDPMIALRYE